MPAQRQPVFNIPASVLGCVVLLVGVHAVRVLALSDLQDDWVLAQFAFVPAQVTALWDPAGVVAHLATLSSLHGFAQGDLEAMVAASNPHLWSVVTYAFLHADAMHLTINTIWLVAFATPVARRVGDLRLVLVLVLTSLGGALAHLLVHATDVTPVVGASAAVSGVMAFAARFVFQPGAPLGLSRSLDTECADPYQQPALPLGQLMQERRVVTFIAVWFGINLVFGVLSQPLGITQSTIAWEAHVGGFVAGLLLFGWLDVPLPRARIGATLA